MKIETETTILDLVRHKDVFRRWDMWDYRIHSPVSLDDPTEIRIVLINEDGHSEEIHLKIR